MMEQRRRRFLQGLGMFAAGGVAHWLAGGFPAVLRARLPAKLRSAPPEAQVKREYEQGNVRCVDGFFVSDSEAADR